MENLTTYNNAENLTVRGLTTFHAARIAPPSDKETPPSLAGNCMNAAPMDLNFGPDSDVLRTTVKWSKSQGVGSEILTWNLPYDVLKIGNRGLQNMPFENFNYWSGDIVLTFQVTGQRFQAGLLIGYWMPLTSDDTTSRNIPAAHCVHLSPNNSTMASIKIPFVYSRSMYNTRHLGATGDRFATGRLGIFRLTVISPLNEIPTEDVNIAVYSRFENSKFVLPKTRELISYESLPTGIDFSSSNDLESQGLDDVVQDLLGVPSREKGANLMNTMPLLDNPMVASGSEPIYNQFPGLAKVEGPEPTVGLQLDPRAVSAEPRMISDSKETSVEFLCSRECIWYRGRIRSNMTSNTPLDRFPLNSVMGLTNNPLFDVGAPFNLAMLNEFSFWKADIVLRIAVIKTDFHQVRLRATAGYGVISASEMDEATAYFSEVLDYVHEAQSREIRIPWNLGQEMLRTYRGERAPGKDIIGGTMDYSLGWFGLYIQTPLVMIDTVPSDIEYIVFGRLENVQVAVPTPFPIANFASDDYYNQGTSIKKGVAEVNFSEANNLVAQSDPVITATDPILEEGVIGVEANVTEKSIVDISGRNGYVPGRKFEKRVVDIMDIVRRGVRTELVASDSTADRTVVFTAVENAYYRNSPDTAEPVGAIWTGPVRPYHKYYSFYSGWHGTIRYRFFSDFSKTHVGFFPMPVAENYGVSGFNMCIAPYLNPALVSRRAGKSGQVIDVEATGNTAGYFPQEVAYPLTNNDSFIDISVPFQTHQNFLTRLEPINSPGLIYMNAVGQTNTSFQNKACYTNVGDDFQFLVFRPPKRCNWRVIVQEQAGLFDDLTANVGLAYFH